VPGGGVEPPRPEGRRILSPLRLPVPPSRLFVEVLGSEAVYLVTHIGVQGSECETVQVNVKVFDDFRSFLSLALELFYGSSRAKMPPSKSYDRGHVRHSTIHRAHGPISI
jgi:hypothetical protein